MVGRLRGVVAVVRLEVAEFEGPSRWRFVLSDGAGAFLADHRVELDEGAAEFEGFEDLHGFVRWRADPGDRLGDEARLVEGVGQWIGAKVLGRVGEVLAERAPVVVELRLPAEAAELATRPFELGYVDGVALARQDVCFVVCQVGSQARAKEPVEEALRVLGVFSLPSGGSALALRRERFELAASLRQIGQVNDLRVEFKAVQYGVTQKHLRDVLRLQGPWDVVHFSGHGLRGGLVLEQEDGSADVVDTGELVGLLRPVRGRLKLVTLSSCYSAAATAAATMQVLGLDVSPERAAGEDAGRALPAVAEELAESLGCAVLAMRYPVVDDFAVDLSHGLYELMVAGGQPLGRALQMALPDAARVPATPGAPPLSVATPGLFGAAAVELRLEAPAGADTGFGERRVKLAGFPDPPPRFVGRLEVMSRASVALAPASGRSGVVFHGMAGAGKTACAVEAAYNHEDGFPILVWWQAPTDPDADISGALTRFALALENKIDLLQWVHLVDNQAALDAFLPRLTQFLETTRILVVLDNMEILLTKGGDWRDPRWAPVIDALCGHSGLGRVVLTTRRRPAQLDDRVVVEAVHALSRDEAVLLARELPHLGALIDGTAPDIAINEGRRLAARTLAVVQGHPKLLELADGQATDPAQLGAHLDAADTTWQDSGASLDAFFTPGGSTASPDGYVAVLDDWTRNTTSLLPHPAQLLLQVLCGMEPDDRLRFVLGDNWADIWRRLEQPGDPPDLDATLTVLAHQALIAVDTLVRSPGLRGYRIHPAIADSTRDHTPSETATAIATELAAYWTTMFYQARQGFPDRDATGFPDPDATSEAGQFVTHAARAAIPYHLHLQQWDAAAEAIEQLMHRDRSPDTLAAVIPLTRRIVDATTGTPRELNAKLLFGSATAELDPIESRRLLREVLGQAVTAGRYRVATVAAGELINLLRNAGRLNEALTMAEQKVDLTTRGGYGPWTQLGDQTLRLQVLSLMGREEEVLTEVEQLRPQMDALPTSLGDNEIVTDWNIRETLIDIAQHSATNLSRWEQALKYNKEALASKQARHASELDVASTAFSAYKALLELKRYDEAGPLLHTCRNLYEDHGDIHQLGLAYTALADFEHHRGRDPEASDFQRRALGYAYGTSDARSLAVSHFNLSNYLNSFGGDPREALAHRLADGLISRYAELGGLTHTLEALSRDLARLDDATVVPDRYDDVCQLVEQTKGVAFRAFITRLTADEPDHDQTLHDLLVEAVQSGLPDWALALVVHTVAAVGGDPEAAQKLAPMLDALAGADDWAALAATVRRILAGDRHLDALLDGLYHIASAVIITVIVNTLDHPTPDDEEGTP